MRSAVDREVLWNGQWCTCPDSNRDFPPNISSDKRRSDDRPACGIGPDKVTDPRSVPHELATLVPHLRTTPVLPLLHAGSTGYAGFEDLQSYPWVLATREYQDLSSLIASLEEVIAPADELAEELRASLKQKRSITER